MKLFEIFGTGRDRSTEMAWREQKAAPNAERTMAQTQTAAVTKGYWLVSKEGKRLSGPFKSTEAAEQYKAGRPDRIPPDARVVVM